MTKNYIVLIVSYETGGGHGEADAVEEGLRGLIEKKRVSQQFKVEYLQGAKDIQDISRAAEDYMTDLEEWEE